MHEIMVKKRSAIPKRLRNADTYRGSPLEGRAHTMHSNFLTLETRGNGMCMERQEANDFCGTNEFIHTVIKIHLLFCILPMTHCRPAGPE
jgi:hypothetical protein